MKQSKQEQEIITILRDNLSFSVSGDLDFTIVSQKLISREHYAHMRGFILGMILVLSVGIFYIGIKLLNNQPSITSSLQGGDNTAGDTLFYKHQQNQ